MRLKIKVKLEWGPPLGEGALPLRGKSILLAPRERSPYTGIWDWSLTRQAARSPCSDQDVHKIFGENLLRVFEEVWK